MSETNRLCDHPLCQAVLPKESERWHDGLGNDYCTEVCSVTPWESRPAGLGERQPSPAMRHFMRLCLQGSRNGCSGGERAARQLAISMCRHAAGLDGDAITAAGEFLHIAAHDRRLAKMLIGYHGS